MQQTDRIPDEERKHKVANARKKVDYNLLSTIQTGHPNFLRKITPWKHAFCSIKRIEYSIFSMIDPATISNKNLQCAISCTSCSNWAL